ncbi:MAG: hypothetical protein CSA66_07325 [Proteobacteria bacterium]|nr:MAG: hypothetical protein CSA66_07325 [Pseudomonadota bacterium]
MLLVGRAALRRAARFRDAVEVASAALGLDLERGRLLKLPVARGEVDGVPVRIRGVRQRVPGHPDKGAQAVFTEVQAKAPWPRGFAVVPREPRARGLFVRLGGRAGGALAVADGLGVEAFDRLLEVQHVGGGLDLVSRLGEQSRAGLVRLVVERGATVERGRVTLVERGLSDDGERLAAQVEEVARLAAALDRNGAEAARAAADIVAGDPEVALRRRALQALCEEAPSDDDTARAVLAALKDEDPELRVMAAERCGLEGFDAARGVALDELAPTALRVRTTALLAQRYPERRAASLETLDQLLSGAPDAVMAAALSGAHALGHVPQLGQLLTAASRAGADSGGPIARALGRHRGGPVERGLVDMLRISEPKVRVEVVRALGQAGSLRAVEHLRPLTSGLLANRGVKAAAREAIAAIQARAGGGEAGQLSLTDHTARGELSLAGPDSD